MSNYVPLKIRMLISSIIATIGILLYMIFFTSSSVITINSLIGWIAGTFGWQLIDHFIYYLRHRKDTNYGEGEY